MSMHGACRVAASVLAKTAMERGSRDNITIIIVDITLQKPAATSGGGGAEGGSGDAAGVPEAATEATAEVAAEVPSSHFETASSSLAEASASASGRPDPLSKSGSVGKYVLLKSNSNRLAAGGGSTAASQPTILGSSRLGHF